MVLHRARSGDLPTPFRVIDLRTGKAIDYGPRDRLPRVDEVIE